MQQYDCSGAVIQNCSKNELNNAYDNTIVYTDYVLSKLIDILKEKKEAIKKKNNLEQGNN